ncbi:MAG: hypothetical protein ABSF53_12625, partial [Terracidiphilus sp.]
MDAITHNLRKIGCQFRPYRDVVSHGLAAKEGDGSSNQLIYIKSLLFRGALLELCANPGEDLGRALCIPSNPGGSRAHFIEIRFITPEPSQADVGVSQRTTDRLTDFMRQGCR